MTSSVSNASEAVPIAQVGQIVENGPYLLRSEQCWDLLLPDGTRAVLGRLLPEAARDESLRRRYVYETERLAGLDAANVAKVLATGPQPDPRDPHAEAPWRLRQLVEGTRFDAWLQRRAPAPVHVVLPIVAAIADAAHQVHMAGAVLRDMVPRSVVLCEDQSVWLTDIGLARVDILSTHTASSLILEGSPFAAPEHLRSTQVDPRADVYTIGVMLWKALTGTLPFGDGPALLREHHSLPPLNELCEDVPAGLQTLLEQCLAEAPQERPSSARSVAELLRGNTSLALQSLEQVICQSCGQLLRAGLRLCLRCGKRAVRFEHVDSEAQKNYSVYLTKAKEDESFQRALRDQLDLFSVRPDRDLAFVIGDARMYSKEEREALLNLPVCLLTDLSHETSLELAKSMVAAGLTVKVKDTHRPKKLRRAGKLTQLAGLGTVGGSIALTFVNPWFGLAIGAGALALAVGAIIRSAASNIKIAPLVGLRDAPAALPASDPFVARLAALLTEIETEALREQVGELALLVQQLCDHRAALATNSGEAATLEMLTEPILPIVELIEREVRGLAATDHELQSLDEGLMIRALATCEARGEPPAKREPFLLGLDRLRSLEDSRAVHMQRLLEADSLLRQVIALGLDVENPTRLADNYTRMALAALGSS